MTFNKIKIGVLGYANIAKKAIIPSILESDKFILKAIASLKESNKQEIEAYQCVFYDSYSKLIEDQEIEAVYIPLPNSLHFEWAKKALIQKKHVIIEKSLGVNYKEVKKLIEIAIDNNLVVIESFQFRFHPQLDYIKKTIKNNELDCGKAYSCSINSLLIKSSNVDLPAPF
jgi:predicted dehydrogenase